MDAERIEIRARGWFTCYLMGRHAERNHEALKALVVAFGPREASRRSGVPYGTISALCFRYKWRKAKVAKGKDVADYLKEALES